MNTFIGTLRIGYKAASKRRCKLVTFIQISLPILLERIIGYLKFLKT